MHTWASSNPTASTTSTNTTPAATTSTSSQTAVATPPNSEYVVQHLNQRYIRSRVLDAYINERIPEFGSDWHRTTIHDHHCITVKRYLTPAEILYLQQTSYPGDFESYWHE